MAVHYDTVLSWCKAHPEWSKRIKRSKPLSPPEAAAVQLKIEKTRLRQVRETLRLERVQANRQAVALGQKFANAEQKEFSVAHAHDVIERVRAKGGVNGLNLGSVAASLGVSQDVILDACKRTGTKFSELATVCMP